MMLAYRKQKIEKYFGRMNKELEVLLVDDCEITQFFHREVIKESMPNVAIHSFENGQYALDFLLGNIRPNVQYLVLLDINMPVLDGFGLLGEMQKHKVSTNVKVVMVSSSIDANDRVRALQFPHTIGYYEKPFTASYGLELAILMGLTKQSTIKSE